MWRACRGRRELSRGRILRMQAARRRDLHRRDTVVSVECRQRPAAFRDKGEKWSGD